MPPADRHQIDWVAAGLRRAASDAGVALPVDYAQAIAADGLTRTSQLGVTRLGAGVVIHTHPESRRQLPIVIGYADGRGQWYRDGHRHPTASVAAPETAPGSEMVL